MKASSSAALDCCAQSRRFVLFVFHGAITITTSARETYATPRPALNTPVHSMVALYTVNTLAASTRLPRRYIDYPSFANARLSYNWRRTERSAHAQHAPDSACPLEERKQRTRHHRVTTVSSTGKVRHMLTSLRAPRVARTPQTQPGSRRAEAGSGAKQRRLAPRSARRSDARFGSPRSALRASLGRLKRSRPVGERKPAAPQAACQAAAPARSNAAWPWSFATEPSASARSRARFRARKIVRGRDAPALPRQTACGAHLGPRPHKQLVGRSRTPPRMGERTPSRRALYPPHQPAARPDRPSARPASRPPRLALDR